MQHKQPPSQARVLVPFPRPWWVVVLTPFLLLGPLLLRGQALFWGTASLQFVPWWVFAWDSLRQGALPLWNPLNGMGAPLIASYQMAFFYPPNWLLLPAAALGGAMGVAWMYTLLAALHLAWAGLGMAALLRRLRFSIFAQVLGGLAFGLGGYIFGRLEFFSMAWAAAWTPWVLLAACAIAAPGEEPSPRGRWGVPLGLALCLGMQLLSGHAQITWYTILLAGMWVSAGALPRGGKALLAAWGRFAVAGLLGAGLAAVQLLPTAELLMNSQRAGAYDRDALLYSFWPWRFLTVLLPDFFGNPARGDFSGYVAYWEDHLYPGMLVGLLALATLRLLLRRNARQRVDRWALLAFCWGMIVLAFVLALGKNTPVFPFLFARVPTFNMFQAPARYLLWAALLLPVLGAVAAERWRVPTGKGLYWFRLATAGAFAVTLGALGALLAIPDVQAGFIRATALGGIWALGVFGLTLALPAAERRGGKARWQAAAAAWLLLDLLVAGWGLHPGIDSSYYAGKSETAQRLAEMAPGGRVFHPDVQEETIKFTRFLRLNDFRPLEDWRNLREAQIANLNLLDGIGLALNFDPLVPERYQRAMDVLNAMETARQRAWLAQMGVGVAAVADSAQPYGVRFDLLPGWTRLRWAKCAEVVANKESAWARVAAQFQGMPDPNRPVIVEGAAAPAGDCASGSTARMQITGERPDRLVIRVDAEQPGWLVLADTWDAGWRVMVEGQPQTAYPADFQFRAVYLEAGSQEVAWEYRPPGVALGGALSILVLFVFAILGRRNP